MLHFVMEGDVCCVMCAVSRLRPNSGCKSARVKKDADVRGANPRDTEICCFRFSSRQKGSDQGVNCGRCRSKENAVGWLVMTAREWSNEWIVSLGSVCRPSVAASSYHSPNLSFGGLLLLG